MLDVIEPMVTLLQLPQKKLVHVKDGQSYLGMRCGARLIVFKIDKIALQVLTSQM